MKATGMKGTNILKRLLALALCLALTGACALAETAGDTAENLSYLGELPDGRQMFHRRLLDEKNEILADTLLCLNRDKTVSWEYTEPDEEAGYPWYMAVRPDGTVAVIYLEEIGDEDTDPAQWGMKLTLKFFTQEGKTTGGTVALPYRSANIYQCQPSFFVVQSWDKYGMKVFDTVDWDGNVLESRDEYGPGAGRYAMVEEEDGILCFGMAEVQNGRAVIMKKESVTGNTIWETMLDFQWEMADQAGVADAVRTADGGYAVLVREREVQGFFDYVWRIALVKLDDHGTVQWVSRELFGALDEFTHPLLAARDGKIVACGVPEGGGWYELETPRVFRWFDETGKDLGTTKLELKPEDFPEMKAYLESGKAAARIACDFSGMEMHARPDGLEARVTASFSEDRGEETGPFICDSTILVKIPEP